MKSITLLMAGVLLLSACAAGPVVSDEFDEAPSESSVPPQASAAEEPTAESKAPDVTDEATPEDAASSTAATEDTQTLTTNPAKNVPTTTTTTTVAPVVASSGGNSIDPGLEPFVDQAMTDLVSRLSVSASSVIVVSAELVEWPDTSLGCPQPGMVYQPVLTDGSLIILSHGGVEYRYHTGGEVYVPFLCQ